jgi:predicted MPP superfamily phosphohydrolase
LYPNLFSDRKFSLSTRVKPVTQSHEHTAPTIAFPHNQAVRWRFLFMHFFTLLLVCISIAQWTVPLWLLTSATSAPLLTLTPPLYVLLPTFLFVLNLAVLRSLRRIPHLPSLLRLPIRLYFAYGFTAVFCLVFLLLCGGIWLVLSLGCQMIGVAIASMQISITQVQTSVSESLRWASNLGVATITLAFVYGYTRGQQQLQITRLTLSLPDWPEAWQGLKLLHLSDLHIGSNLSVGELQNYFARANALVPDLVFLTGDLLDANPAYIPEFFPLLNQLTARYGVFACLGNHDVYAGAQAVAEGLARYTHITLLRDQIAQITINGLPLHIVGLEDRGKDWARGLDTLPLLSDLVSSMPITSPRILLSHRPDLFPQAASEGFLLTLSGHTHGGQIALPGWQGRFNLARFITRFPRGLYSHKGRLLYVNRGLGVTGQRVRIFTPREIALLTCEA